MHSWHGLLVTRPWARDGVLGKRPKHNLCSDDAESAVQAQRKRATLLMEQYSKERCRERHTNDHKLKECSDHGKFAARPDSHYGTDQFCSAIRANGENAGAIASVANTRLKKRKSCNGMTFHSLYESWTVK